MVVRRLRLHLFRQGTLVGVLAIFTTIVGSGAAVPAWAGPSVVLQHIGSMAHPKSGVLTVGYRKKRQNSDEEALALFDEGQYELDSGFPAAAIRIFKTLVSRYPDTEHALKAQKMLARLLGQDAPRRVEKQLPPKHSGPVRSVIERKQSLSVARPAPAEGHSGSVPDQFVHDTGLQYKLMHAVGDRVFFAPNSSARSVS